VTTAGQLISKQIIHAVGPIYSKGLNEEDRVLRNTYNAILQKCEELHARSISIPPISCAIFMYPSEEAAKIFFDVLLSYIEANAQTCIEECRVTIKHGHILQSFIEEFDRRFLGLDRGKSSNI
jgi:O-acetyl-ADP-ribose deacetylase (regulator of RNase III)